MKLLMVSTEYPPMPGGVGRYTANLTSELRKAGLDVYVVCDEKGNGQYSGLSPKNPHNSDVLLKIVNDLKPDVVHVQFEPGLYGLILDPLDPKKSGTYIDSFYTKCKIPIVTTFHTGYSLGQWISQASLIKKSGRIGKLGIPARALVRFWKYFLNYQAFNNLNKEKLRMSRAGIVFSHYMSERLDASTNDDGNGGNRCHVIYHGSEPAICPPLNKKEAREKFSLPQEQGHRIALAHGFRTAGKGWDILEKMKMPDGWTLVVNSSKGHYSIENLDLTWQKADNILDLQRGFLSEEELSTLFYACDAAILPYKVTAGSGVMFDALAHGLPFIATDLDFFREFAAKGLGITAKRNPHEFSKGIKKLDRNYFKYAESVDAFKQNLKWNFVARQHSQLYYSTINTRRGLKA
ncbi:MAG TPA: glycosyltransferase [Nitrososphaeraceae archaeon]|jgi:glycosyltransferase involved in cell wall biosynthesis|nr:glycosyltransferase [Nitrososphaeraceae archaeon]